MPTVIKAADRGRAIHEVAFNFDDMSRGAEQYLAHVRQQAAQILAEATQQAHAIRQQAETAGRLAGQQAVDQMIDRKITEKMHTALPALQAAAAQIEQARDQWLLAWQQRLVHLATAIASRIVRAELQRNPEIPLNLVREALELASGATQLRIRVHPGDRDTLAHQLEALIRTLSPAGKAQLVSDPAISPGGCRVETEFGAIDQQLESQLARIEQELL